jgi:hypothetical protein
MSRPDGGDRTPYKLQNSEELRLMEGTEHHTNYKTVKSCVCHMYRGEQIKEEETGRG